MKGVVKGLEGGYGWEVRGLFGVLAGWTLVGADMSGLELRCLGHYLSTFDGGTYADVVVNGDVHTVNQMAFGMSSRDKAKTATYALFYGSGASNLGPTADAKMPPDPTQAP